MLATSTVIPNPVDALWSLILCQTKNVRDELAKRFVALDAQEREKEKWQDYEKTLSPDAVASAHELAQSIADGICEVENARAEGRRLKSADDFLKEMMEEEGE